jgi:hypothetical protein
VEYIDLINTMKGILVKWHDLTNQNGFLSNKDSWDKIWHSRVNFSQITSLSFRMLAGLNGEAELRAHTFRRCSVLRSDFLNGPEIVFTVPAGIAMKVNEVTRKFVDKLPSASSTVPNSGRVIGLDWYRSEESTHSEASDLSVDAPSLLSLVWQLWLRPPAHQTDPCHRQDVGVRRVTMRMSEHRGDCNGTRLRPSMAKSVHHWTNDGLNVAKQRASAQFGDIFEDAMKMASGKTRSSPWNYGQLW